MAAHRSKSKPSTPPPSRICPPPPPPPDRASQGSRKRKASGSVVLTPRTALPSGPRCACPCEIHQTDAEKASIREAVALGGLTVPVQAYVVTLNRVHPRRCRCRLCGPWITGDGAGGLGSSKGFVGCLEQVTQDRWDQGCRLCPICESSAQISSLSRHVELSPSSSLGRR